MNEVLAVKIRELQELKNRVESLTSEIRTLNREAGFPKDLEYMKELYNISTPYKVEEMFKEYIGMLEATMANGIKRCEVIIPKEFISELRDMFDEKGIVFIEKRDAFSSDVLCEIGI